MKRVIAFIACAVIAAALPAVQSSAETIEKQELSVMTAPAAPVPLAEICLPYSYGELSEQAQKCYLDIRRAVIAHKNSVKLSSRISLRTLNDISDIIRKQDPIIIGDVEIEFNDVNTDNAYAKFSYSQTKEFLDSAIRDSVKQADNIIAAIRKDSDEKGRLRSIFDYIAENTVYTAYGAEQGENAYGALVSGEASSKGYAYAVQLVCSKAGISSVVVYGTDSLGSEHVWNKVRINGSWYNVDCAQSDIDGKGYFMIDDSTVSKTFTQDTAFDYPAADEQ